MDRSKRYTSLPQLVHAYTVLTKQDAQAVADERAAQLAAELEAAQRAEEAQRLAEEEQERREEAAKAREAAAAAAAAKPPTRGRVVSGTRGGARGRGTSSRYPGRKESS
jgi:high-affinity K+ transport system ATPase subunit B